MKAPKIRVLQTCTIYLAYVPDTYNLPVSQYNSIEIDFSIQ